MVLGLAPGQKRGRLWFKFATLWTLFLVVQIGMVVLSLARGNPSRGVGLVPTILVALLALGLWWPYRRIKSGKPFPIQRA